MERLSESAREALVRFDKYFFAGDRGSLDPEMDLHDHLDRHGVALEVGRLEAIFAGGFEGALIQIGAEGSKHVQPGRLAIFVNYHLHGADIVGLLSVPSRFREFGIRR